MSVIVRSLCLALFASNLALAQARFIPPKSSLPVSPENFCAGMKNIFSITTQSFKEEADFLCANNQVTPLFQALLTQAYQGTGEPIIQQLLVQENEAAMTSQITVAYAMKINKDPVKVLLGEEKHVSDGYNIEHLTISARFLAPPINKGESDTAFLIEQKTTVNARVKFEDISTHDLRLYQPYLNNFDFFFAARTLKAPTEQFKKSVIIRAIMQDPKDEQQTYALSILNFVMNSREQHDRVVEAFTNFIRSDFNALYAQQVKK